MLFSLKCILKCNLLFQIRGLHGNGDCGNTAVSTHFNGVEHGGNTVGMELAVMVLPRN